MEYSDIRVLHITNNLGIGGVQKIVYEICKATKNDFGVVCAASTGGVFADRLSELGIEQITIPDLSTKNLAELISIHRILKETVKKNRINVIHCHHRMAVPFARLLLGKEKVIYNNHTIYSDKKVLSGLFLRGVHIIADGEKAKENVREYFGIKDPISVINNAVDEFDGIVNTIPEIENAKNNGDFIVMNSARLHPQKGIEYFIDAAEILIRKGLKASYFIVGDGPLREELVNRVNTKGVQSKVFFLGFRSDIKSTISQADVLVLTSVYEGLPLTPMEAFSVRKAVVATAIDGTREVVIDNENGLLAETKNPKSIAGKIEELYLDRRKLKTLCDGAYTSYVERFSASKMTEQYRQYYKDLK